MAQLLRFNTPPHMGLSRLLFSRPRRHSASASPPRQCNLKQYPPREDAGILEWRLNLDDVGSSSISSCGSEFRDAAMPRCTTAAQTIPATPWHAISANDASDAVACYSMRPARVSPLGGSGTVPPQVEPLQLMGGDGKMPREASPPFRPETDLTSAPSQSETDESELPPETDSEPDLQPPRRCITAAALAASNSHHHCLSPLAPAAVASRSAPCASST